MVSLPQSGRICRADLRCSSCGATPFCPVWVGTACSHPVSHGTFIATCEGTYQPPDEFDPIPWFTEKDAQQALERMHAWASTSDPLMRLVWDLLDDTQRLNLARVAMELRPR